MPGWHDAAQIFMLTSCERSGRFVWRSWSLGEGCYSAMLFERSWMLGASSSTAPIKIGMVKPTGLFSAFDLTEANHRSTSPATASPNASDLQMPSSRITGACFRKMRASSFPGFVGTKRALKTMRRTSKTPRESGEQPGSNNVISIKAYRAPIRRRSVVTTAKAASGVITSTNSPAAAAPDSLRRGVHRCHSFALGCLGTVAMGIARRLVQSSPSQSSLQPLPPPDSIFLRGHTPRRHTGARRPVCLQNPFHS